MTKKTRRIVLSLMVAVLLAVVFTVGAVANTAPNAAEVTKVTFKTTPCEGAPGSRVSTTLYVDEGSALMDFQIALSFSSVLIDTVEATPLSDDLTVQMRDNTAYITFTNVENNLSARTELVTFTLTLKSNIAPNEVDADTGLSQAYPFITFDEDYHASSAEANTMDEDLTFRSLTIADDFGGVSVYAYGDVNKSGHISINDVTVLRQYLIDMRELTDAQTSIANVYVEDADAGENADENGLSIFDAALIQKSLTSSDITLSPLPSGGESTPVAPPAVTPDDTNEQTPPAQTPSPETCEHTTSERTVTDTVDGHSYTITRLACACGEVSEDVSFVSDCNFDIVETTTEDSYYEAMSGTAEVASCPDCRLCRRVSSLEGPDTNEDGEQVLAYCTLTEYVLMAEDETYTVLFSLISNYRTE